MKYLFYSGFYCCIAVMMLCSCNGRNKGSDNSTESTDSAYDISDDIQGDSHNSAENMEASSSGRMNTENGEIVQESSKTYSRQKMKPMKLVILKDMTMAPLMQPLEVSTAQVLTKTINIPVKSQSNTKKDIVLDTMKAIML